MFNSLNSTLTTTSNSQQQQTFTTIYNTTNGSDIEMNFMPKLVFLFKSK